MRARWCTLERFDPAFHSSSRNKNMTIADIKKTTESKMGQSIEALKNNLARVRTGRASPSLLDSIHVDYYGSMVPLSQVANVNLLDARTISVQPWEKSMSAKVEKAIRESDLGLNPASLGDLIRVPIDRKSTRLNSSHSQISYAVFCLKKKKKKKKSNTLIKERKLQ